MDSKVRAVVEDPGSVHVDPTSLQPSAHFVCHLYFPLEAATESRLLGKEAKELFMKGLAQQIGEAVLGDIVDEEGNL